MNIPAQLFMFMAEHYRRTIYEQCTPTWIRQLPALPCTTDGIKDALELRFTQDAQLIMPGWTPSRRRS